MLEINDLTIEVNQKIIIKNLSFIVNKNDKVAIIGEEGNGKSTLLKAIYNSCNYANIKGQINCKNNSIGYLKQTLTEEELNKSVFQFLFIDDIDYYNKINDLYKNLKVLDLKEDILNYEKMINLSGGEKVKVQLLNILLNNNDILLLDEPTNDLDLETLSWLEKFIINESRPIIFVSHDETLLSKTANIILHLELLKKKTEPKFTFLKISYDEYVNSRIKNIQHTTQIAKNEKKVFLKQEAKLKQIMNKVDHQQATITRADPHGGKLLKKKMKSIKSQEKKLYNKEITEIPDYEESLNFFFEDIKNPNKKEIVSINDYTLKIGDVILSKKINLKVVGNEHIVIIGKNGIGKTTLLKKIYEDIKNKKDIKVGFMPQNYDLILQNFSNPITFLCKELTTDMISKVRSYMGNVKFTKEEMTGSIENLSGGSKAKLILLKLVLDEYSVLILDEPTRNVSPLSNPVIRQVLKNYNGTIISVSHDRKYIDICDKVYELNTNGLYEKAYSKE